MSPEDYLAQVIRERVQGLVHPSYEHIVCNVAAQVIVQMMNDPVLLNQLQPIKELRQQIAWLHNENIILKSAMNKRPQPRKAPAKRVAKRAPTVKGGTPQQRAAFRQGYTS